MQLFNTALLIPKPALLTVDEQVFAFYRSKSPIHLVLVPLAALNCNALAVTRQTPQLYRRTCTSAKSWR